MCAIVLRFAASFAIFGPYDRTTNTVKDREEHEQVEKSCSYEHNFGPDGERMTENTDSVTSHSRAPIE